MNYYLEYIEPENEILGDMLNHDYLRDDCPHQSKTWTEEKITDTAQYVGFKCDACGDWVDGDIEEDE